MSQFSIHCYSCTSSQPSSQLPVLNAIFHPRFSTLLNKMIFIHIIDNSGILVLSNIRDFYRLADPVFFSRSVSEREINISINSPSIETHLAVVRGLTPRSFKPSASTRRAQLSVAAKDVRPTDLLQNVRY